MKKYLFLIVPVVIIVLLTIPITNAHLKEVEEYESLMGRLVLIDNDTLEISNYNRYLKEVTLSDNSVVAKSYAESKLINP